MSVESGSSSLQKALLSIALRGLLFTTQSVDEVAESLGVEGFPDAWAKLVQGFGKRAAIDLISPYVRQVLKHEALRLDKAAKTMATDAELDRCRAAEFRAVLAQRGGL